MTQKGIIAILGVLLTAGLFLHPVGVLAQFGQASMMKGTAVGGGRPTAISPLSATASTATTNGASIVSMFQLTMSPPGSFTGTITDNDPGGYTRMSGNSLVAARNFSAGDVGSHNLALTACQASQCLAPQTFLLTKSPQIAAVCSGPSPDPQAATDGFTSPKLCLDFTQASQPSNLFGCDGNVNDFSHVLHVNPIFGTQFGHFPGCQYVTHEIDPATGQYALHLSFPCSVSLPGVTNCDFAAQDAVGTQVVPSGNYKQGFYQFTVRSAVTTPGGPVPAPQYLVPGSQYTIYEGTCCNGSSAQTEYDIWETWTMRPNCPDMQVLNPGSGGSLSLYDPCFGKGSNPPDPTVYSTWAWRATGDGSSTKGITAYINGKVVGSGTTNYITNEQGAAGPYFIWLNMGACQYGGTNTTCHNVSITSVYQSGSSTGITLNTPVNLQDCGNVGERVWIQGGTGIAGLNGLHTIRCTGRTNPETDFILTDLPWPGGSYGGGAVYNPVTSIDMWVQNIQYWTCPSWDLTLSQGIPPNKQCNSTVLAAGP